jgi:hypothetical protein
MRGEPINGNSVKASNNISIIAIGGVYRPYVITSYTTTIAMIIEDFCLLNNTKYSRTTSRIQNIIKDMYPDAKEITNVEKGITSEDVMIKNLLQLLED